ncbi:PAS domain S-box protein [Mastigocoleus testarum]|uniref:histidine kinase n=1 Tax=Mastigocoleus testarum BC008 TaxID=371196 RepID=A0A0V7ZPE5_9CYAN|nr:PAS domain S-box protein [Mastigocoleus testarum]KST66337.1 hypothetical protein BC008_25525 [Mastigocoleus testarum BC008]KST66658.1 hypothetical protein BC008_26050 [Mastigocoleus testarum BC008]
MESNSFENWPTLEQIVDATTAKRYRTPLKVTPDTSVFEAITLMNQGDCSCVLVADGMKLVGVFTAPDIVKLIGAGKNLSQIKIKEVNTKPVTSLTLTGCENIFTALSLMHSSQVPYLTLLDRQGQLLGLVTQDQIQQQAEIALQQNKHKFRAIFDSTFEFMVLLSPEGIAIEANQTALNAIAAQRSDVIGQPFYKIPWWADFPQQQQQLQQAIAKAAKGELVRFESKHIWTSGTFAFVDFSLKPFFDSEGKVVMLILEGRDITTLKQAESKLQVSQTKFEALVTNMPGMVYRYFPNTPECPHHFTYVSEHSYQLLELAPQKIVEDADTFINLIHPEDLPSFLTSVTHAVENFLPWHWQGRITTPSGILKWIEGNSQAQKTSQGDAWDGLLIDISQRKLTEQKIAQQAALIDIATDAIFVRDLDNCVLFWSEGAQRLYGWTATEAIGKTAHELFHTESSSQLAQGLSLVLDRGFWQGELKQVTKNGQEIIVVSRWTLVRDESGQPKSILAVNSDITEKKKLEQQFYHSQRLETIGTLATGIAHDFNNLLTPILTIAQLLPLRFSNIDQNTQQLLTMVENSARRGADLVKQLLYFNRGTEGKQVTIQLEYLLEEVISIAQSTFPKTIDISKQIPKKKLGLILADSTQIHQVFMNVLINAQDAMPNGGNLTIKAQNRYLDENYARMNWQAKVGSYVIVTISDTGVGIPPHLTKRIFDPFFTTKEFGKGKGLGLATVEGIVKSHGGFVKVDSQLGKGTQFEVFLPAVEGTPCLQNSSENLLPKGNGELILIVDDEEIIRQTTKTSLQNYNYKTLLAKDGIEAITIYAEHKKEISLVLMDLMMPNMDGLTTIRAIHKINPHVKVIPTSGLPADPGKTFPPNIKTFLLKPYTIEQLLNAVNSHLSPNIS